MATVAAERRAALDVPGLDARTATTRVFMPSTAMLHGAINPEGREHPHAALGAAPVKTRREIRGRGASGKVEPNARQCLFASAAPQ